ncbi:uncharacterized protein C5orf34 homolog isoform X2 [Amia ocellicauda]|uniref:uncharacterized protein C5orf34 homolog isoform X2 n=1 Tax=Amia ocellicauda TaxID=2972642 RepID=UPI003464E83A
MMASVSLMALYEDESVEVRYGDGSCLQLSPCGCESVLEKKSPVTSHPLQPNERIRQRTRFVISSYKELMVKALEFRNRFATRPYLPGELIPANNRTHFYIDVLEAEWPAEGSGGVKLTDNGRVTVSSVDGRAFLHLSSSGQEFSVEFLCKASPKISQPLTQEAMTRNTGGHSDIEEIARARTFNMKQSKTAPRIPEGKENRHSEVTGLGSCSNHSKIHQQSPVPGTSQTHLYTWVLQHHSVLSSPAIWHHPLSLAIAFMKSKEEGNTAAGSTEGGRAPEVSSNSQEADVLKRETSCLPGPLPLNCPMPHQHRWNYGNTHSDGEQDLEQHLRTELVKVVWCQGIVYRVIKGLITTVEIYPGDGSVIRSKGAVANYFTHHTAKGIAEQTEEKMYLLSSLPPDVPGQRYSISSVVTRANRILQSYSQTRLSLKLPNTFCCWKEENSLSVLTTIPVLIEEAHIPDTGRFSAFSDGRVHVLFRDGVTLHMMWNFSSQSSDAEVCECGCEVVPVGKPEPATKRRAFQKCPGV